MYSPLSAASLSSIVDVVVHDARLLCIGNFYVSCWDGFPSMPSASYIGKQLKQWSVGTVAVGLLTKSCCFISIRNVDGVLGKWYHTGIINFPHPATSAAFNYGDFWVQDSRPIGRCEIKRRGDCSKKDTGEVEHCATPQKQQQLILPPPSIHPLATATQSREQQHGYWHQILAMILLRRTKWHSTIIRFVDASGAALSHRRHYTTYTKNCLGFGLFTQHAQDQKRRQLFEELKLGIVSCIWHAMNTVVIQVAVSFRFQIALHCLV